ncbi:TPA: hypothetical protein QCV97_005867 [Bacillus cereus]|nr:hypothetical protein [Bacillus cereus]
MRKYLSHLSQAIQFIALSKMTNVPMFAAKMTKDSHAYDLQIPLESLLFHMLTFSYEKKITNK